MASSDYGACKKPGMLVCLKKSNKIYATAILDPDKYVVSFHYVHQYRKSQSLAKYIHNLLQKLAHRKLEEAEVQNIKTIISKQISFHLYCFFDYP